MDTFEHVVEELVSRMPMQAMRSTELFPMYMLVSEGEYVPQLPLAKLLYFDPVLVPTRSNTITDDLADTDDGAGYIPANLKHGEFDGRRHKVRTLRMAWRNLLRDLARTKLPIQVETSGFVIVCERRALPLLHAWDMMSIATQAFKDNPDMDVLRLFDKHTTVRWDLVNKESILSDINAESKDKCKAIAHDLPAGEQHTKLSVDCDGTYAMCVRRTSLEKVAELFDNVRMPVDTALEYAQAKGKLKVMKLSDNLFVRLEYGDLRASEKTYEIVMSNYGRPVEAIHQAMHINTQLAALPEELRSRVGLHIVLRGYDKATSDSIAFYLNRLTFSTPMKLTIAPNRTQLLNFIESYSGNATHVLKVDDDDIYAPGAIEAAIRFHDHLPDVCCSLMKGPMGSVMVSFCEGTGDRTILRKDSTGSCENTSVFSKRAVQRMHNMPGASMRMDKPKASDAIPMHAFTDSFVGYNRYMYWRHLTETPEKHECSTFAILSYEGAEHATGKSSYGSFATTAGVEACEYGLRVSDFVELRQNVAVRPGMEHHRGLDAVIVLDKPTDRHGMYIPTNPTMCTPETGAAQVVQDVVIENASVVAFVFARTQHRFVYEEKSGQFVSQGILNVWKNNCKDDTSCVTWFRDNYKDVLKGRLK